MGDDTRDARVEFRLPKTMQEAREMLAHKKAVVQDIDDQLDPKRGRRNETMTPVEFARWKVSASTARARYVEEIAKIDNWIEDQQDLSLIDLLAKTRKFLISLAESGTSLGDEGYEIIGELKNHEKRLAELYGDE